MLLHLHFTFLIEVRIMSYFLALLPDSVDTAVWNALLVDWFTVCLVNEAQGNNPQNDYLMPSVEYLGAMNSTKNKEPLRKHTAIKKYLRRFKY